MSLSPTITAVSDRTQMTLNHLRCLSEAPDNTNGERNMALAIQTRASRQPLSQQRPLQGALQNHKVPSVWGLKLKPSSQKAPALVERRGKRLAYSCTRLAIRNPVLLSGQLVLKMRIRPHPRGIITPAGTAKMVNLSRIFFGIRPRIHHFEKLSINLTQRENDASRAWYPHECIFDTPSELVS